MPPLTSPADCGSCLHLTQQISELEERISILYQIRDKEWIMDSLVTVGWAVINTANGELDSTITCLDAAAAKTTDHWAQLEAKPKSMDSSNPQLAGRTMVRSSSLTHTCLRMFNFPTHLSFWISLRSGVNEASPPAPIIAGA